MQFAPDGRLFVCEQGGRLRVDQERRAAADAVRHARRSTRRASAACSASPSIRTSQQSVRVRLLHGDHADRSQSHQPLHRQRRRRRARQRGRDPRSRQPQRRHEPQRRRARTSARTASSTPPSARTPTARTRRRWRNLLGKMLRINSDGTIPTDNPFFGTATGTNRAIWALGLRNPFTFAFNPHGPEMFINDVGQSTWEEINDGLAGANYGWPTTEGPTSDPRFVSPRYAYDALAAAAARSPAARSTRRCNAQFPGRLRRRLLLRRLLRRLDPPARSRRRQRRHQLRDRHRLAGRSEGGRRRQPATTSRAGPARRPASSTASTTAAGAPTITTHPASRTVAGRGVGDLQRQRVGRGAAALSVAAQRREHRRRDRAGLHDRRRSPRRTTARASAWSSRNDFGSATSNDAVLTVTANQAPTATIAQPAAGTLYSGGNASSPTRARAPIRRTARCRPAPSPGRSTSITTRTSHPFMRRRRGATSGSFTIPTTGETAANVWYRIYLTVRDSGGLTHTTQRDVLPRTVAAHAGDEPGGRCS